MNEETTDGNPWLTYLWMSPKMGFLNVCASDMFVIQRACRGDILRDSVTSQAVVAEGKTMFVWVKRGGGDGTNIQNRKKYFFKWT